MLEYLVKLGNEFNDCNNKKSDSTKVAKRISNNKLEAKLSKWVTR